MDILAILILLVHELGIVFHLFVSSSISFNNVLQLTVHKSFTCSVKFINYGVHTFLTVIINQYHVEILSDWTVLMYSFQSRILFHCGYTMILLIHSIVFPSSLQFVATLNNLSLNIPFPMSFYDIPRNKVASEKGRCIFYFYFLIIFNLIFLSFQGHTHGIWRFPAQGSNQSCSCCPSPQPQQCP